MQSNDNSFNHNQFFNINPNNLLLIHELYEIVFRFTNSNVVMDEKGSHTHFVIYKKKKE